MDYWLSGGLALCFWVSAATFVVVAAESTGELRMLAAIVVGLNVGAAVLQTMRFRAAEVDRERAREAPEPKAKSS